MTLFPILLALFSYLRIIRWDTHLALYNSVLAEERFIHVQNVSWL